MFIATLNNDAAVLQNVMKRIDLCFADTLEDVTINARIFYISNKDAHLDNPYIVRFASVDNLRKYLMQHENIRPKTKRDRAMFSAYSKYIGTAIDYLFKSNY